MRETWYVLDDGSAVDPNEVAPDDAGVLRHKSGVAVALGPYGHISRGVDPDAERADGEKRALEKKDIEADPPKRTYRRRDMKAD